MKESNQRPVEAKSAGASPVDPAINFTEENEGSKTGRTRIGNESRARHLFPSGACERFSSSFSSLPSVPFLRSVNRTSVSGRFAKPIGPRKGPVGQDHGVPPLDEDRHRRGHRFEIGCGSTPSWVRFPPHPPISFANSTHRSVRNGNHK